MTKGKPTSSSKLDIDAQIEKLKELFLSEEYETCIKESQKILNIQRDNFVVCRILGNAHFALKNYHEAVECFEQVSRIRSATEKPVFFRKARTAINRIHNTYDEKTAAWEKFSNDLDIEFDTALTQALNKNFKASILNFDAALEKLNISSILKDKWLESYNNIIHSLVGSDYRQNLKLPMTREQKKIIVSGMGWSGSGAIFDYLSEFENVIPIDGESPYIEGSRSLRSIYSELYNQESLIKEVLKFFFYGILGYARFRDEGDFKLFQFARAKAKTNPEKYTALIFNFSLYASNLISAKTKHEKLSAFQKLSSFIVNSFSINKELSESQVALMDNVVHISNIHCIEFLEETNIICSFRDPRSNYVALLREAAHFSESASRYLRGRGTLLRKNHALVERYSLRFPFPNVKSVKSVPFEMFVLSEKLRDNLAKDLGLNLSKRSKHSKFKPWESLRNIALHQEHDSQEDIKKIEEHLSEYCFEPWQPDSKNESRTLGRMMQYRVISQYFQKLKKG